MSDGTQPLRSIAAELALLYLRELEPRVADDPELLVSTEAVLSFAAIRHSDPVQWEYWRAILEKYEKSDLIEYMLRQPARSEDLEWQSRADRLIRLALDAGLKLFHDPDQQGWASVALTLTGRTLRSVRAPSSFFCCASITSIPARAQALRRSAPRRSCSRHARCLMEKSVRSTC